MSNWTRPCAAGLAMLAAGCATAPSEPAPAKPCPPVQAYTLEEQLEADRELGLIAEPCTVCAMLDDLLLMRDQCR